MSTVMEKTVPLFVYESLKDRTEAQIDVYERSINERDARIAELEKQLNQRDIKDKQKDNRIAQLEKNYLDYRNTLTQTRNIIFHPKIQQTRDRVLLTKLLGIEVRKGVDEEGFFECYRDEIKREAHLSVDATSDGLKSLEKHGLIELDHRDLNPGTKDRRNVARVKILKAVKEDVLNAVTNDVKSNYGGERATQCPECKKERIKKTRKKATLCQCMDCKHQWIEDESEKVIKEAPVTAQDYAERDSEHASNTVTKSVNVAGIPQEPDWLKEEMHAEELHQHMDDLFPPDQLSIMTDNSTVQDIGQLEPPEETGDTSHLDYDAACQLLNELTESSAHIEWLPDGKRMLYAPKSTVWEQQQWRKRIVVLGAELKDLCEVQV